MRRAAENKLQGDVDIDAQVEAFMKRQAEMESGGRSRSCYCKSCA